jgi:hypothetical protein
MDNDALIHIQRPQLRNLHLREPSSFGNPQVNQYSSMSEDPYGTEDQFLHAAYPSMKDIIGSNL